MTSTGKDGKAEPRRVSKDNRRKRKSGKDRARRKPAESQLSVIERLLGKPVTVLRDGKSEKLPAVQAIVLQLLQRSLTGDKKAERALQKFEEFARRKSAPELEIVFVDNDYTTAFAASGETDNG